MRLPRSPLPEDQKRKQRQPNQFLRGMITMKKTTAALRRDASVRRWLFDLCWFLFGRGESSYRCLTIRIADDGNAGAKGSMRSLNTILRRE